MHSLLCGIYVIQKLLCKADNKKDHVHGYVEAVKAGHAEDFNK